MTPQRNDSEPPLPDLRNLGNQKEVEKTRGGWRWWFVLPVIAALVFWWAAWGWGNTGGYLWGFQSATHDNPTNGAIENRALNTPPNPSQSPNSPAPAAPSAVVQSGPPPSGPGVKVLDATDKQPFIGKSFQVANVPVERKVNDRALWIATSRKQPMLVVIGGGSGGHSSAANIQPGSTVDAMGTVKKAPPATEAARKWDLTDADAARLEQEGAYIQVSQLTIPQPHQ